jgi:hypothetical protein
MQTASDTYAGTQVLLFKDDQIIRYTGLGD